MMETTSPVLDYTQTQTRVDQQSLTHKKKKRRTSVTVITRRRNRDGSVTSSKTKMQGTVKDAMALITKQNAEKEMRASGNKIENVHLNIT